MITIFMYTTTSAISANDKWLYFHIISMTSKFVPPQASETKSMKLNKIHL